MFEAYTEASKRAFLFGRMEAEKSGSSSLETEHLFLGLLACDPVLATRLFKSAENVEDARSQITSGLARQRATTAGPLPVAAGDLPLTKSCQRMVAYANGEAENLRHTHLAPEHLLLGILRENTSLPAQVMLQKSVTLCQLEAETLSNNWRLAKGPRSGDFLNLVDEASMGAAWPTIGHNGELDTVIQILCRRTRNSAVLVGAPGVGKRSIVRGIAARLASQNTPAELTERDILQIDAAELAQAFDPAVSNKTSRVQKLLDLPAFGGPVLYVPGLFDLGRDLPILAGRLQQGALQIIATSTPLSFRLALDRS